VRTGTGDVRLDRDERRLWALEALCDPLTTTMLRRVGLARDWRCLEIGAGRGSIARWLAEQCPHGSVTATDTDIRHLADLRIPNLRVRRHDVVDGPGMPKGSFNLAHTRALLVHLPDRQAVLHHVRTWLASGGWLVIEEPMLFTADPRHESSLHRALAGFERLMADQLGSDFRWPRHLTTALRTAGFAEVNTTMVPVTTSTTTAVNEFWRINLTELGPDLIEAGYLDQHTLAQALAMLNAPNHVDFVMAFVCASGRRPTNKRTRVFR
jgi:SAM-dependent methyltransferase